MFAQIHIITSFLVLISSVLASDSEKSEKFGEPYETSTAKLLLSRGYLAVDHFVDVQNGSATISLIRATNPKIRGELPNRNPLVVDHGMGGNANSFMVNIDGVVPLDHSSIDINSKSLDELQALLKDDPASNSIVFAALNLGYEVWLINRRPTMESQFAYLHNHGFEKDFENFNRPEMTKRLWKLVGSGYWNFSLDEQARFDLPEIIEYIIEETGSEKLAYVGHSAGSVIFLGALIYRPDIGDKISKAVLWGPAVYGRVHSPLAAVIAKAIIPFLIETALPVPPAALNAPLVHLVGTLCRSRIRRALICNPFVDSFLGSGASQQKIENYNQRVPFFGAISTHEAAQLLRLFTHGKAYQLKQIKESRNFYPREEPHVYDVSKIKYRSISLWAGNTDAFVPVEDMDRLIRDFTVPVERHAIGGNGILFNHVAFLTHNDVAKLVIIPSLKTLASDKLQT